MNANGSHGRSDAIRLGILGGLSVTVVYAVGYVLAWRWIYVGPESAWSVASLGIEYGLYYPGLHLAYLLVPPFAVAALVFSYQQSGRPTRREIAVAFKWYLLTPLFAGAFLAVVLSILAPLVFSAMGSEGPSGLVSYIIEVFMVMVFWLAAAGPLVILTMAFVGIGATLGLLSSAIVARPVRRAIGQ